MYYGFDVEVALEYGVNEAIILNHLVFWINKNKANNRHFYDGRYWTYNSQQAFSELFPFWSKHQIHRLLKSLEERNIIIKGNYNKASYDRTLWYAISDSAISKLQNRNMEVAKLQRRNCDFTTPIPDNNQIKNTDINTDIRDIVEQSSTSTIPYIEIIDYLNKKTGKNFKSAAKATQKNIKARFNDGFTLEDFKRVIDIKCEEWLKDSKMSTYLRPETLFGTKFEGYLNSKPKPKPTGSYIDSTGLTVL